VLARPNAHLAFGSSRLRPAILPDGGRWYLLTMLRQDAFWIDEIRVLVRFNTIYLGSVSLRKWQINISVDAPPLVQVRRE
jgi:hypothetical protein